MRFLRTGIGNAAIAALWAAFDALVHVRIDMVEPLRIAGNVVVWVALAASIMAVRGSGGPRSAAVTCAVAALVVLVLNAIWAIGNGELPGPALMFFVVAILLLLLAARRFRSEAAVAPRPR